MEIYRRTFIGQCAGLALGATIPLSATRAAQYPEKNVRIIIPYPAGGATDNLGRLVGQSLQQALGQSFIADNKGGGGTTIGTRALAQSAPDGYTIGMIDSSFTINPGLLGARLTYNTLEDFAPISLIATAPFVLVAHPSVPVVDLASFIARAKALPGSMAYGSAGVGSGPHLAGEQLSQQAGIEVRHIPYKGGSTVITDLLGGQFQFAFATVPTLAEYIKSGRLRGLAVTSAKRVPQLPDLPTFAEVGFPGVDTSPLFGMIAPAGVPAPIINKLSAVLQNSIRGGGMNVKLKAMGFEPVGSTPEEFAKRIRDEVSKWEAVIRKGKIQAE